MKTIPFALGLIAGALAPAMAAGIEPPAPNYIACRVHRNATAVFPSRLLNQGVTHGEASVVIEIDHAGRVTDRLLTSYTHPDFGDEAMRTIRQWSFEPGTADGRPVISVLTVNFEFTTRGVLAYERHTDALPLDAYYANRFAYYPHGEETLDQKPVAVTTVAPIYPEHWQAGGHVGLVTVQFFIDEEGRARMPIVIGRADPLLGAAATAALKGWKFQPPSAGGKPVLVHAELTFVFPPGPSST